jgi:hypothetical protein
VVSVSHFQINQTEKKVCKDEVRLDLNGFVVSLESIQVASELSIAISNLEIRNRVLRVLLNRLLKIREGLLILVFPKERESLRIETFCGFFSPPLPFSKTYSFARRKS